MAQGRRGIGCGSVILIALIVALAAAWAFGALDRLVYLVEVQAGLTSVAEKAEQADTGQADLYVYAQLSDEDREKYLILLDAFETREGRAYPETDMDDLARMRDCVLADHPELFYVNGVQIQVTSNQGSGIVTDVTVEGQYSFSAEEAAQLEPQIQTAIDECVAGAPTDGDDYAKAKYVYEYLAALVEYDHEAASGGSGVFGASSGQTVADALVGRSAVCAGYARSFELVMWRLGIACVYVTGEANGASHAWCAAYLDGSWYFVDPTWGDPQFLDEWGGLVESERVNYDYLGVTAEDIALTHSIGSPYPLPSCTAMADNFYVREGLYVAEPDVEAAGALIEDAASRGEPSARFRCADAAVYDYVVSALFDGQEIYRFMPGNSCSYVVDPNMRTVEIIFG